MRVMEDGKETSNNSVANGDRMNQLDPKANEDSGELLLDQLVDINEACEEGMNKRRRNKDDREQRNIDKSPIVEMMEDNGVGNDSGCVATPIVEMMVDKGETPKEDKQFEEYSPDKRYGRLSIILGHGSQKLVYKAIDIYDAQEVAWSVVEVKECPQSFLNEINLLKAIQHPNIIKLKEFWFNESHLIFITELMTSGTLREYIKTVSPTLRVIKCWARQILLAIEHLHSKSMIHRDIKCENIFVNGSTGEVKLGDLGIAKKSKQKRYTIVGTPEFMAREVFEGDGYGEGVDVYAFGMALLEMSIREYPYTECTSPHEIFKRVMTGIPPQGLFSVTDACLRDLIIKCIATEESRITIKDCMKHHFIVDESDYKDEADESSSFKTGCKECFDFFSKFTFPNMALPSSSTLTAVSFKNNILNLQLYYKEKDRFVKFEFDILKDTEESISEEMIIEKVFKRNQSQWVVKLMEQGLMDIKEKIRQQRPREDIFYRWANNEDLSEYKANAENGQKPTQRVFDINDTANEINEAPTTPNLTEVDFPKRNYPDETPICDFVRETSIVTKRDIETANGWIKALKGQEIEKISDLRILVDEDWDSLGLTVFSSRAMKNMLYGKDKHPAKEKDLGPNTCSSFDDGMTIEDFIAALSSLIEREVPSEWIDKLLKEDVRNVGELRSLTVCDWERFEMSVFAKRIIKNVVFKKGKITKAGKVV